MREYRNGRRIVLPSLETALNREFLQEFAVKRVYGDAVQAMQGSALNPRPVRFLHGGREYHFAPDDLTRMVRNELRDRDVQIKRETVPVGRNGSGPGFSIATFEAHDVRVRTQKEAWNLLRELLREDVEITVGRKS